MASEPADETRRAAAAPALWQLFVDLLLVSATSWGGFAVMAAAERKLVQQRGWLAPGAYANAIALAWSMPGAVGVNALARMGYALRGWWGAAAALVAAATPASLGVAAIAAAYAYLGGGLHTAPIVAGLVPVICASIFSSGINQARSAITSRRSAALAAACGLAIALAQHLLVPLLSLLACAFAGMAARRPDDTSDAAAAAPGSLRAPVLFVLGALALWIPAVAPLQAGLTDLFLILARLSLSLFGGALIIVPLLQDLFVRDYRWLDGTTFAAALAASQSSPGPLLSSVVFMGFTLHGWAGAGVAALAVFVPPALAIVVCGQVVDGLMHHANMRAAMRGVRVGVVGLTFASAVAVGRHAKFSWVTLAIFGVSMLLLQRTRLPLALLFVIAGGVGWLGF
ncbi:MAG: chromate transporter [Rhodocyclaceae bacterium]|nr:chromate transporter [Rhodocyclaceae bacterium]MBX3668849.1 chromate transporter [Rhodocyclaceae bacterium]